MSLPARPHMACSQHSHAPAHSKYLHTESAQLSSPEPLHGMATLAGSSQEQLQAKSNMAQSQESPKECHCRYLDFWDNIMGASSELECLAPCD